MEVKQLRADDPPERVIRELAADADMIIPFDCASSRVKFAVHGYFVCPKGSLMSSRVTAPS